MNDDFGQTIQLVERASAGQNDARDELFSRYQSRLCRMVAVRLDRRAQGRIDPADVVQEAYIEALRKLPDYLANPSGPFYLWLRCIALYKLMELLRRELDTEKRDPGREVRINGGNFPESSSGAVAEHLIARITGPNTALVRAELKVRLHEAVDKLDPLDREILTLRHFEQLDNAEAAQVLRIEPNTACKRHVRALLRLKESLASLANEVKGG